MWLLTDLNAHQTIFLFLGGFQAVQCLSKEVIVPTLVLYYRDVLTNDVFEHLRNRKHFPCSHTVIETRVEVWENAKLKWEHGPAGRVFPRNFEFFQTSTSVSITYGNT